MGVVPYPTHQNFEMIELLESGYRMPNPPGCSSEYYQVMKDCWEKVPIKRPKFSECMQRLALMSGFDAAKLRELIGDGISLLEEENYMAPRPSSLTGESTRSIQNNGAYEMPSPLEGDDNFYLEPRPSLERVGSMQMAEDVDGKGSQAVYDNDFEEPEAIGGNLYDMGTDGDLQSGADSAGNSNMYDMATASKKAVNVKFGLSYQPNTDASKPGSRRASGLPPPNYKPAPEALSRSSSVKASEQTYGATAEFEDPEDGGVLYDTANDGGVLYDTATNRVSQPAGVGAEFQDPKDQGALYDDGANDGEGEHEFGVKQPESSPMNRGTVWGGGAEGYLSLSPGDSTLRGQLPVNRQNSILKAQPDNFDFDIEAASEELYNNEVQRS